MRKKIIQFENVSRSFSVGGRTLKVLDGVSLYIDKGSYIAVIGKSGSGKSTLLNLLTGIDHPTSGSIQINGKRIHSLKESDLARWRGKNIGIIFQFFQLIPTLTILENILLAMEFVNVVPKVERYKNAKVLLEQVGILDHQHKLPSELSGGEQQRAAIARSLANKPDILVADEPTGNLDSVTARSVKSLFRALVNQGTTLILVTHEKIDESEYDQIIHLQDGKRIFSPGRAS